MKIALKTLEMDPEGPYNFFLEDGFSLYGPGIVPSTDLDHFALNEESDLLGHMYTL